MKQKRQSEKHQKPPSEPTIAPSSSEDGESDPHDGSETEAINVPDRIDVPVALAGSGTLDRLVESTS